MSMKILPLVKTVDYSTKAA